MFAPPRGIPRWARIAGWACIAGVVVAVLLGIALIIVPLLALRDFLAHFWTVFQSVSGTGSAVAAFLALAG